MKNKLAGFLASINLNPVDALNCLAILFLGYAFYNPALRFVPVDFDDLVLLSAVKNVSNPLAFFVRDWGFGNYGYRPLHSVSLWLGYKVFGVSSGPNQLINLSLHILAILLLYALLSRLQPNRLLAFLFSLLGLVSLYSLSPATWVSDRPTLFVAVFLLLSLNYLFRLDKSRQPSSLLLFLASLLALMSKESGLLVPLTIIATVFLRFEKSAYLRNILLSQAALILAYVLLRFVLFGFQAGTYDESGYLFGTRYYENSAVLSGSDWLLAKIENLIKNTLAIFLPLFDGQGKFSLIGTISNSIVLILTTVLLSLLGINQKLTAAQKIGLVIIILNALIHIQVFRYRTLFLGQLGFAIFLAGSPAFGENKALRSVIVAAAAALLFFWSMQIIGENITYLYLNRLDFLRQPEFESRILASSSSMDPEIVKNIIAKYRH